MRFFSNKRIYLDYASAAPLDERLMRKTPHLSSSVIRANPHALHREGVEAGRILSESRKRVANILGAHAEEIIFTSGATESNTLAIIGSVEALLGKKKSYSRMEIITSSFEHPSVLMAVAELAARGATIKYAVPNEQGIITAESIASLLSEKTVLISCVYGHNEIGTLQPIKEIAKVIRQWKKLNPNQTVLFHVDATQAAPYYLLNVDQLHPDLLTIGSTKLYTHRGVGALYCRRGVTLHQQQYGGSQEFGIRPGTEPLFLIYHFSWALVYAHEIREKKIRRLKRLQEKFETLLTSEIPNIKVSGAGTERLPHITHVVVPHIESELMVIELDARGIAVSSKSACKNDDGKESSILAFLYPNEKDLGALRFSYGRMTTLRQLKQAVSALKDVLAKYNLV